jgi:hypothetical protein
LIDLIKQIGGGAGADTGFEVAEHTFVQG